MEKLAEIIKLFLEKYFVPSMISAPVTIIIAAIFPDILSIRSQTNLAMYVVAIFCVVFIIVWTIQNVARGIRHKYIKHKNNIFQKNQMQEELQNQIKMLWSYVDKLNPSDKEVLFRFIHTHNEPVTSTKIYFGNSIFNNEDIMNVTTKEIQTQPVEYHAHKSQFAKEHICMPINRPPIETNIKMYKLKDDFFRLLKYSYEHYHQISNFKEDNQYDKT